jgi:molecular chaperone GrpE
MGQAESEPKGGERPEGETPEARTATETAESAAARLTELETRCAELEARWLRAQADYQNTRRRAQQELEAKLLATLQPLLDELLLVADCLDLALASPAAHPEAKGLAEGVALTRAKLSQALELVEVRPVPAEGRFDPALHEAGETRVSPEHPPGTILATLRPGYSWQGRILRPARVAVAAGPLWTAPSSPPAPPSEG